MCSGNAYLIFFGVQHYFNFLTLLRRHHPLLFTAYANSCSGGHTRNHGTQQTLFSWQAKLTLRAPFHHKIPLMRRKLTCFTTMTPSTLKVRILNTDDGFSTPAKSVYAFKIHSEDKAQGLWSQAGFFWGMPPANFSRDDRINSQQEIIVSNRIWSLSLSCIKICTSEDLL